MKFLHETMSRKLFKRLWTNRKAEADIFNSADREERMLRKMHKDSGPIPRSTRRQEFFFQGSWILFRKLSELYNLIFYKTMQLNMFNYETTESTLKTGLKEGPVILNSSKITTSSVHDYQWNTVKSWSSRNNLSPDLDSCVLVLVFHLVNTTCIFFSLSVLYHT